MTYDTPTYAEALVSLPEMDVATATQVQDMLCAGGIFGASQDELAELGLSRAARRIVAGEADMHLERSASEIKYARVHNIKIWNAGEPDFPARLLACPTAPARLFALGDGNLSQTLTVGIVGTRHATPYGVQVTRDIVKELAQTVGDVNIISGLAYGIDVAAHTAALENNLATTAVMATPMNTIYPAAHRDVAMRIARGNGLLVTELPTWAATGRATFLARNRIIAALSDVVIVVESDVRGGALGTAHHAANYRRPVYAVPGRITDQYSQGTNAAINSGLARQFTSVQDMLGHLGVPVAPPSDAPRQMALLFEPDADQQAVLDVLASHPDATTNHLAALLAMPYHRLTATLIELEEHGLVEAIPGSRFRIR